MSLEMKPKPEIQKQKSAKARSPAYPAIGLKEAVDKITAIYNADYQNPISREVVVAHMGYNGLNGKSLTVLSSLSKYGLLEGRGDNSRVSDLALAIIAHKPGDPEYTAAIKQAASNPELFAELDERFGGKVSDHAIRSYLMTQKFLPVAADAAIRAYRETKTLVENSGGGYNEDNEPQSEPQMNTAPSNSGVLKAPLLQAVEASQAAGTRRAVFALDEGDVVITFPVSMSPNSVADLEDYLAIFMKKAKRDADSNEDVMN